MWENSVVTNGGNSLLATWVAGTVFNIDSAKGGTGTVEVFNLKSQTALASEKQTLSVLGIATVTGGIQVRVRITAPATGYTLNQLGIWGSVDGGTSTLIALYQDATGIAIPAAASVPDFVYTFYALIEMSNSGTLSVTIDTSALVSASDLVDAIDAHEADATAHPGKLSTTGDGTSVTAAFETAGTRTNIVSGETLTVIFGKIRKFFTDLKTVAFTGAYSDLSGTPSIPAGGTPGLTFSTSNSSGSASTFVRTDATILAFDSSAPSTQAFGDSAAAGSSSRAARRDHKHAMPTSPKDTTAVTGMLKGNGTAISAATRGTDYSLAIAGTGTIASSASWSGPDAQGYYTYAVTATGVASTDNVDITRVLSVSDSAAAELIQAAWDNINDVVISANTLTFYATTRPSVAVPIAWRVVR